ncbi:RNA-directed DNA polymerase from mobile element jockey, partial [Geodia barretti]
SLLCISSKVLERIVFNQILQFVNDKISNHQFGFMLYRSTLHQLLLFFNSIFESSRNSSQTDVLYLDFKKAFDSVAHNELLFKLWHIGITGNAWKWLLAYLTNRSQCVSINSKTSTALPVISGVPQGSILGPLLFLIYINDLPEVVLSSKVLLFADDAKCFKSISNFSDCMCLQDDLKRLAQWSSTWSLPFNDKKCSAISVHSGHRHPQFSFSYHLNNTQLLRKTAHTDLGVVLTPDLKWRDHYVSIMAKSYKSLLVRLLPL